MDNKIKQNILGCQNVVEQIRNSINNGKCVICQNQTCKYLLGLYNALSKLAESIKHDLPIETPTNPGIFTWISWSFAS